MKKPLHQYFSIGLQTFCASAGAFVVVSLLAASRIYGNDPAHFFGLVIYLAQWVMGVGVAIALIGLWESRGQFAAEVAPPPADPAPPAGGETPL